MTIEVNDEKDPEPKFTLLQHSVLNELSARVQLGYNVWTWPSKFTTTMNALEKAGYINWKSSSEQGFIIAWFTPLGKTKIMPADNYRAPIFKKYVLKEEALAVELENYNLTAQLNFFAEREESKLSGTSDELASISTKAEKKAKKDGKKKAEKNKKKRKQK